MPCLVYGLRAPVGSKDIYRAACSRLGCRMPQYFPLRVDYGSQAQEGAIVMSSTRLQLAARLGRCIACWSLAGSERHLQSLF